ncbi:hypothetical protein MLD38_000296 [Melastoma candidum]|uniref:Uncharacterized protein n=1 Tax=Melastoma candidum TaxID=119954 RepID=A0ACB9S9P6_9MYRT|nr:hypothetical protein MLD38_000296 [Melastoma candidum]
MALTFLVRICEHMSWTSELLCICGKFPAPGYLVDPYKAQPVSIQKAEESEKMADWGPVFVAVVLFVLLMPGLLVQIPGKHRIIEFGNFHTSGASILVHTIIYFALICVFLLVVGVHMYTDS